MKVSAVGAAGSELAQKTYGMEAGQALSIGRVVLDMGIAPQADIDLLVESNVAGAVYAWASVVDNTSTDQTFVTPLQVP
ncbi:MAG: hypothetical protein ACXV7D_16620 [Thermoanaerobaculia bacterium]